MVLAILEIGMLRAISLAASRASFRTVLSSLRSVSLWMIFSSSFLAASLFFFRNRIPGFRLLDDPVLISVFSEFILRLAFEYRVLELDSDCTDNPVTDVYCVVGLLVELVHPLSIPSRKALNESPVAGVLTVHERKVGFAVVVRVGKGKLNLLSSLVADVIDRIRTTSERRRSRSRSPKQIFPSQVEDDPELRYA
jgi:mRNA-degrading endonuclease toxin of MazEF toxin-antitoxin module